jgi:hypothetical protein
MATQPSAGFIQPRFASFSSPKNIADALPTNKWYFSSANPKPKFGLQKAITIKEDPNHVAARICDSLRLRSVNAIYNKSEAICTTSGFLVYAIYLYDGDSEDTTLVEVIRRKGCGFAFRMEREAVLNSARGFGGIPPSKFPTIMKIPEDMLKTYKPPTQREHEDTLIRATDNLHSKDQEVRLFTLQNLSAITTSNKVNHESAYLMSRLILKNSNDARDIIVSLMSSCMNNHDDGSEKTLNSCLSILSNILMLTSEMQNLEGYLAQNGSDFAESMVPYLVSIVKSSRCPHSQCLALKCLCLILKNSSESRNKVSEEDLVIVRDAESYGKARHKSLETEARSILAALKCQ